MPGYSEGQVVASIAGMLLHVIAGVLCYQVLDAHLAASLTSHATAAAAIHLSAQPHTILMCYFLDHSAVSSSDACSQRHSSSVLDRSNEHAAKHVYWHVLCHSASIP